MAPGRFLLPLAASLVASAATAATDSLRSRQEQIWDIPPEERASLSSSSSFSASPSSPSSPSSSSSSSASSSSSNSQQHNGDNDDVASAEMPRRCPKVNADSTKFTMREDFLFSFFNVFIVESPDNIVGAVAWNPFSSSLEVRLFSSGSELWAVARASYGSGVVDITDCADRPVARLVPSDDWALYHGPHRFDIFDGSGKHKHGHAQVKEGEPGHRTMRFYDQEEFLVSKILQWSAGTVVSAEVEVFSPSEGHNLLLSDVRVLALISALHLGNFLGLAFGPAVGFLVGLTLLCCLRSIIQGTKSAISRCFSEEYSYETVDPNARHSRRGLPNLFVKRDAKRPLQRFTLGEDADQSPRSAEAESSPSWLHQSLFRGGSRPAARTYSRTANNSNSNNNHANSSENRGSNDGDGEGKLDLEEQPDPFGACLCQIQSNRINEGPLHHHPPRFFLDRLINGDIAGAGRQVRQALSDSFRQLRIGGRQPNDFQRMESFTEVDGDADVLMVSEAYSARA